MNEHHEDNRSEGQDTNKIIEEMLNSRSDEEDHHDHRNDHLINQSSKKLLEANHHDSNDFSLSEHHNRSA